MKFMTPLKFRIMLYIIIRDNYDVLAKSHIYGP